MAKWFGVLDNFARQTDRNSGNISHLKSSIPAKSNAKKEEIIKAVHEAFGITTTENTTAAEIKDTDTVYTDTNSGQEQNDPTFDSNLEEKVETTENKKYSLNVRILTYLASNEDIAPDIDRADLVKQIGSLGNRGTAKYLMDLENTEINKQIIKWALETHNDEKTTEDLKQFIAKKYISTHKNEASDIIMLMMCQNTLEDLTESLTQHHNQEIVNVIGDYLIEDFS